ncbi:MAG: hypothetical protein H0V82_08325 [Candidatus Protochlamydia sp.]|nr:hypothetical protein [Candidatus Protochlamydia sp.]
MNKQHYKKLNIEFPIEEYTYLKMACAKKGVSLKEFVTRSLIKSIEEYEDELDSISLKEALTEENIKNAISWNEAEKILGWDKL